MPRVIDIDELAKLPPGPAGGGGKVVDIDELAKLPPRTERKAAPEPEAAPAPPSSGGYFGGGQVEAAVRGGLDAATFGGSDELGAMIEGVQSLLKGDGYGKAYDEAVARRRKGNEAYATAYPKTTAVGEVAGGVLTAPFLPIPGAGAAGAAVGRVAGRVAGAATRGAVEGAAGGAAHGFGSGEDTVADRLLEAAKGGAVGGVAGGVLGGGAGAVGLGRPAGRAVIDRVVDASGNLTPEASAALSSRGIAPNTVSLADATETARLLQGTRSSADDVAATLRTVLARKHGVDVPAPFAAQDQAGVAKLQQAQAGGLGAPAQRAAETAGMEQGRQFEQAARDAGRRTTPGAKGGYGESGTGKLLAEGVNQRADAEWKGVRQRYGSTGAERHMIVAGETGSLFPAIRQALDKEHLSGITEGVPGFTNAMQTLRRSVVDNNVSFADADEIRKRLGQLSRNAADKTDRYKIDTVIKAYDDWLDGVAGSRASTLPADSVAALKDARRAAKDWFGKYQRDPRNPGDAAGKAVEQIRQGNLDNQKLFDTLMGSRTKLDEGAMDAARRVRDIVGDQSPEWQTLQQGMRRRLLFGDADQQAVKLQPGEQVWKTIGNRVDRALDGRGGELAREMLGDTATTEMRELAEIAHALEVKGKAGNWSGTDYSKMRRAKELFAKAGIPAIGLAAGGLLGGLPGATLGGVLGTAGRGAGRTMIDRMNVRDIEALLRPYAAPRLAPAARPVPSLAPAGGLAGGLADWLSDREKR